MPIKILPGLEKAASDHSPVPALDKAISILEYLEKNKRASLSQIVKDLNFPKTSVFQILKVLCRREFISMYDDNTYKLGLKLFELGNKVLLDTDIRVEAQPFLRTLMNNTKQTCHLAIIQGNVGIYLLKELYQGSSIINSWVGKNFNLYSTSLGRCLLAWKSEEEIDYIFSNIKFEKLTQNTVSNLEEFKDILRIVRIHGWAEEVEENRIGVRCISVPIRDITKNVIASISISGLSAEIVGETRENIIKEICKIGFELSSKLGYIE